MKSLTQILIILGSFVSAGATSAEAVDYKALAAQLDFNDAETSAFEMRRVLVRAFADPVPTFVMNHKVGSFEPEETDRFRPMGQDKYQI